MRFVITRFPAANAKVVLKRALTAAAQIGTPLSLWLARRCMGEWTAHEARRDVALRVMGTLGERIRMTAPGG